MMKLLNFCAWFLFASLFALGGVQADLVQTFEDGENTTNWGSAGWTDGTVVSTFLDSGFGGDNAGSGDSVDQTFSREFRDNTDGINVTTDIYSMSMYVQIDAFGAPSDGRFEILDGNYGTDNTANLRIRTDALEGGGYSYNWEAQNGTGTWLDLDIDLSLTNPYLIQFIIDPVNKKYSTTVSLVNDSGEIQSSKSLSNLDFDLNVVGNGHNGNLLFYVQASSGTTVAKVDNINIQGVPEPTAAALTFVGFAVLMARRQRRGVA